jgi:hypothetical protein
MKPMFALRNKKTDRLLVGEPRAEETYDNDYDRFFELWDSEYGGQVYVTTEEQTANILIMDGRCNYPDVRIDFGHGKNKFTNLDLEIVEVRVT